jgi:glycosyltransferase involved in cell wall biosynthesis
MSESHKIPVGVLILARDEEANLPDCLHSVRGWAQRVVVVLDPRTKDRSRAVAQAAGAEVVEREFDTYAGQRNWALGQVGWGTPWILIVDADERVSPELVQELAEIAASPAPKAGYALRRRFIFYGRWIRHCWYSSWDIRFFRLGKARYEERKVHEHMFVDGPVGYLRGDLIHNDFKGMDDWIAKHNRYATWEAEAMTTASGSTMRGRLFGTREERRRFLKEAVWNRLPFRPLWLFVYLYIFKLGIMDGALGFRFCLMHAIFDAFTTAKVWEKRHLEAHPTGNYYRETLASYLARHTDQKPRYE